jgi:hypothetical protein
MVLASRKAPGRNEAKGALEVLRMLSLEGCIINCSRPSPLWCSRGAATQGEPRQAVHSQIQPRGLCGSTTTRPPARRQASNVRGGSGAHWSNMPCSSRPKTLRRQAPKVGAACKVGYHTSQPCLIS